MARWKEGGLLLERATEADPRISADIHNHIFAIQKRLLEKYADAEFDLVYGPDHAYHLKVFTSATSMLEPMEVVEDALLDLMDQYGVELYVVPLRLADLKNDSPQLPRHLRGKPNGTSPSN